MSLVPGQILENRYRIEAVLGQGGFGAIYLAWDIKLEGLVAIKANLYTPEENQKQFNIEARLLFKLRHPNLPRVIDLFDIPGKGQYIVMDYIEGRNLKDIIEENWEQISIEQAIMWLSQICDALIYLHEQPSPIIHRDIKPSNIRITSKGEADLLDFGIAKVLDQDDITSVGARAISPHYSSPEQIGQSTTDELSDIYSLGTTAYHFLTGSPPPPSMSVMAGLADPPIPVNEINPFVSLELSNAIAQAMAPNREERTRKVVEFKNALSLEGKRHGIDIGTDSALSQSQPLHYVDLYQDESKILASKDNNQTENEFRKNANTYSIWFGGLLLVGVTIGLLIIIIGLLSLLFRRNLTSQSEQANITVSEQISMNLMNKTANGYRSTQQTSTPKTHLTVAGIVPASNNVISTSLTLSLTQQITASQTELSLTQTGTQPYLSATLTATPSRTNSPTSTISPIIIVTILTATPTPSNTNTPTKTSTNTATATKVPTATQNQPNPGEILVFSSNIDTGTNYQLYSILPDGSTGSLQRLTISANDDSFPNLSQDGRQLLFSSNRSGNWEIILTATDNYNDPRYLTNNNSIDTDPALSPDKTKALYTHQDPNGEYSLYSLNVESGYPVRLTSGRGNNIHPVWSPNSDYIYFASNRDSVYGAYSIWQMDSNGSNAKNLTGPLLSDGEQKWPAISPDGNQVAFASSHIGDNNEIYILDLRSNSIKRVTYNLLAEDTQPTWSPDGQVLAFISNRDGDFDIYTILAGGSELDSILFNVTNNSANDREPHWGIRDIAAIEDNANDSVAWNIDGIHRDQVLLKPFLSLLVFFTRIAFINGGVS